MISTKDTVAVKPRGRNNYGEARILHWMLGKKKKAEQSLKGKRMACNLIPKLTTSPSHRNIHKKSSHQAQTSDKKNPENKRKNWPQKKQHDQCQYMPTNETAGTGQPRS